MKLAVWLVIVLALSWEAYSPGPCTRFLRRKLFPEVVAELRGEPIFANEASVALRERVWREGGDWEALTTERQHELQRLALDDVFWARTLQEDAAPLTAAAIQEAELQATALGYDPTRLDTGLKTLALTTASYRQWIATRQQAQVTLGQRLAVDIPSPITTSPLPQRYRAAHLFLTAHEKGKGDRMAEIEGLRARLSVEPFEVMVAQHSDDERTKRIGGDLGWFSAARMPAEIIEALSHLGKDELSPVVRTPLGWHVLKLLDTRPAESSTHPALALEAQALAHHLAQKEQLEALKNEWQREDGFIVRSDQFVPLY